MNKNTVNYFSEKSSIEDAVVMIGFLEEERRPKMIKAIFKRLVAGGWVKTSEAIELFNSKLTPDNLTLGNLEDFILDKYIKHGQLDCARKAAELFNRELTGENLEAILGKCVEEGWVDSACEAAKLRGCTLTEYELLLLLDKCIEKKIKHDDVRKVVALLSSCRDS